MNASALRSVCDTMFPTTLGLGKIPVTETKRSVPRAFGTTFNSTTKCSLAQIGLNANACRVCVRMHVGCLQTGHKGLRLCQACFPGHLCVRIDRIRHAGTGEATPQGPTTPLRLFCFSRCICLLHARRRFFSCLIFGHWSFAWKCVPGAPSLSGSHRRSCASNRRAELAA